MQLDGPGQKYIYNYISNLIIQWKRQNNKKENIRVTAGLEPEPRGGVEGYKRQTYNLVSRRGEILKKNHQEYGKSASGLQAKILSLSAVGTDRS